MVFQKTKFIRWLIISLSVSIAIPFLVGCGGPEVELGFPLDNGSSWVYQGITTYKVGGQEEEMPPVSFRLSAKQLSAKKPSPFGFSLIESGEELWSIQLASSVKGIVDPFTGQIWLPFKVKEGKTWKITVQGDKVKMMVGSLTKTTVPAGTFSAYVVVFSGPRRNRGSFWLNPDVGIVAFDWIAHSPGGESKTHLELSSYNLP